MIELFSRKPDILGDFEGAHLTPIPFGEEARSLSAILMDKDYYSFTYENSETIEDLRLSTPLALICLKAKAFIEIKDRLDNKEWKTEDEHSKLKKDYKKHIRDIIRISLILPDDVSIKIDKPVLDDMLSFLNLLEIEEIDYKQLAKTFNVAEVNKDNTIQRLKSGFNIE